MIILGKYNIYSGITVYEEIRFQSQHVKKEKKTMHN